MNRCNGQPWHEPADGAPDCQSCTQAAWRDATRAGETR